MAQSLGSYTFYWDPDEMDMPYSAKVTSELETITGSQVFEWAATIVGKNVSLKWDYMPIGQWNALRRRFLVTGTTYIWDPQIIGSPNPTFNVVIKNLTGSYFKHLREDREYRKDVVLTLSIRSKQVTATTTTTTSTA